MFAKPRPKKSVLPPPSKKRKNISAVDEVNFDFDAREEYLTGFHKRKQQRIKNAQEENAKRAREEKLEMRKQVRRTKIYYGVVAFADCANICLPRYGRNESAMSRNT
jgi:ribosomal RNA-processing protein 17